MTVRLIEDVARQGAAERPAIETAVSVPRRSDHEAAPPRRARAWCPHRARILRTVHERGG